MTPEEIVNAVLEAAQGMSRPVFRGQECADWKPHSGAVRRLCGAHGDDILSDENELRDLVSKYHREQLIMPMEVIDGKEMTDMQRLSELQHLGAGTGMLDFTESALIALWFACKGSTEMDGRIFLLDIGDHQAVANGRSVDEPFEVSQPIVYYEPDQSLSPRINAQQSIFVICKPLIPDKYLGVVEIPCEAKEKMHGHLTRLGFTETRLFPDIPGFAAANSTTVLLKPQAPLTPEQYRKRGNRAYQAARYADALVAYEQFAAARPDVAQPHSLMGDALAAMGRFEEAVEAYTRAIDNIDNPIDLGQVGEVCWENIDREMLVAVYFNRGNAYAAIGNHQAAIEDFDRSLESDIEGKRNVLMNRGNSKFALEMHMEAYDDYSAAWSKEAGSDSALAMGNCKVMVGEFEEAMRRYIDGSAVQPETTAAFCRENMEQIYRLLEMLEQREYRVRREGNIITIEAEGKQGIFTFKGNRGNSGNIPSGMTTAPGGKGYGGMMGIVVSIVSPKK